MVLDKAFEHACCLASAADSARADDRVGHTHRRVQCGQRLPARVCESAIHQTLHGAS